MNAGLLCLAAATLTSCATRSAKPENTNQPQTFGHAFALLKAHTDVILLSDDVGQAQVAVVPALQGRVMTSTAQGAAGLSFGWINEALIRSGTVNNVFNAFGGEDRFWIGPEGSKFGLFFAPGESLTFQNWRAPAPIDREPWTATHTSKHSVELENQFQLQNRMGAVFDIHASRSVRLLAATDLVAHLKGPLPSGVKAVAFETENRITNAGDKAWSKATGLVSIWMLGMFNSSDETVVVIPIRPGRAEALGPPVIDDYYGKVPSSRIQVRNNVVFFRGDAQFRSKIGISPKRALPIEGSYDPARNLLTLVQFTPPNSSDDYVFSQWDTEADPFSGDVINSYNDGPSESGTRFGAFYELESSSPARELAPGQSLMHLHRTIHLQGSQADLDPIARAHLGVSLSEIVGALPR